jgi:hypothetical protein
MEVCKDNQGEREPYSQSLVLYDDEYSASNSDTASPSEARLSQVNRRMHEP